MAIMAKRRIITTVEKTSSCCLPTVFIEPDFSFEKNAKKDQNNHIFPHFFVEFLKVVV